MQLYKHQQDILDKDPKRCGLFLGTGSGKTRIALLLARGTVLVVAPKMQAEDRNWQREAVALGLPEPTVISKETFRRDHAKLPAFDTVIADECHTILGVTPNTRFRNKVEVPKASQLFEAFQAYVARTKPERLYLLSATIVKTPMTVWAAGRVLGYLWDFYAYRAFFYTKLPMPGREVYAPKSTKEVKEKLASLVHRIGFVGRLEDYFDVPEQTYRTVTVGLSKEQKDRIRDMRMEYPDAIVRVGKVHQIENGVLSGDEFNKAEVFASEKIDKILEYADEFPKMVVFAKYRLQIEQIRLALKKIPHLVLTGDTKDRGDVLRKANTMDRCVLVVSAQISAGWELPCYNCMVFASRTYSYVDYAQSLGRILRANHIKKNIYINLVVKDGVDDAVNCSLLNKKDFDIALYATETS